MDLSTYALNSPGRSSATNWAHELESEWFSEPSFEGPGLDESWMLLRTEKSRSPRQTYPPLHSSDNLHKFLPSSDSPSVYTGLSSVLSRPGRHIVFDSPDGLVPHIVITTPDSDPWEQFRAWFLNTLPLIDPLLLHPPLPSSFVPLYVPALTSSHHCNLPSSFVLMYGPPPWPPYHHYPQSPQYSFDSSDAPASNADASYVDPALPILRMLQCFRGVHLDESLDPQTYPHILVSEGPPTHPLIAMDNATHLQDSSNGRWLTVPLPDVRLRVEPPSAQTAAPEVTPEPPTSEAGPELYTIPEEDEFDLSETEDDPDSPYPTTPDDDDEQISSRVATPMDHLLEKHWDFEPEWSLHKSREAEEYITSRSHTPMWPANLPTEFRLDEDDEDLPPLDEW